jgi:uncharacterized membrane protein (UPF0182 family)
MHSVLNGTNLGIRSLFFGIRSLSFGIQSPFAWHMHTYILVCLFVSLYIYIYIYIYFLLHDLKESSFSIPRLYATGLGNVSVF